MTFYVFQKCPSKIKWRFGPKWTSVWANRLSKWFRLVWLLNESAWCWWMNRLLPSTGHACFQRDRNMQIFQHFSKTAPNVNTFSECKSVYFDVKSKQTKTLTSQANAVISCCVYIISGSVNTVIIAATGVLLLA